MWLHPSGKLFKTLSGITVEDKDILPYLDVPDITDAMFPQIRD